MLYFSIHLSQKPIDKNNQGLLIEMTHEVIKDISPKELIRWVDKLRPIQSVLLSFKNVQTDRAMTSLHRNRKVKTNR